MNTQDHPDNVRSVGDLQTTGGAPACGIARDLMPLRLESLCGEASADFVDRHIAGCQPCAAVYAELRAAPPAPVSTAQADLRFPEAFRQMLRAIRLRGVLLVLLGALLGLLLLSLGSYAYDKLCVNPEKPIPLSAVACSLRRMENGAVLMVTDTDPKYRHGGGVFFETNAIDPYRLPAPGDPTISYYQPLTTYIYPPWQEAPPTQDVSYSSLHFKDGVLYEGQFAEAPEKPYGAVWNAYATEIREIRLGTPHGESILVYKQGDDIPPCTPEEEVEWARQVYTDGEYDPWAIWYSPEESSPDEPQATAE